MILFPDTPDNTHLIQYCDVLSAIRTLLGNSAHAENIVYRPKKAHLPSGAALVPVIIATDKTQLMQFSNSKSAYPVYLTLGNIPRVIRHKPSQHACILIAYLSVNKVMGSQLTAKEKSSRVQCLFHESMRIILKPLKKAGIEEINITGGDGAVRRVHPVLACYVKNNV
ncbi:hypothetical protein SERLA73DRAFT_157189 [Serpula lacrymans var. lacrymans S7.3]|uniref:Uncharacterized protein n=1 Tax=Serpula lacrymans var. lacrymans (strain S7.3) TaxID=936435 RepID=F8QHW0_SERL3|nr:hypothetical protein SERLA73DRAFT_157189 [Serpula lacrymans var. lacrymans S7.3]